MTNKITDGFKEYSVSVICMRKGGKPGVFNCDVCGRKRYFASPCTSEDCEERMKDFCNSEGDNQLYYDEESW